MLVADDFLGYDGSSRGALVHGFMRLCLVSSLLKVAYGRRLWTIPPAATTYVLIDCNGFPGFSERLDYRALGQCTTGRTEIKKIPITEISR